jgi:hypothetical protein
MVDPGATTNSQFKGRVFMRSAVPAEKRLHAKHIKS